MLTPRLRHMDEDHSHIWSRLSPREVLSAKAARARTNGTVVDTVSGQLEVDNGRNHRIAVKRIAVKGRRTILSG
jgi:hypothetical protein